MEIWLAHVPWNARRPHHGDRSGTRDHKRLSKVLSKILRHDGPSSGVPFDEDGYARVHEVRAKIRWPVSWDDVNECVKWSIKRGQPRFEVKFDEVIEKWVIRATSKWSTSFGSACGSPLRTPVAWRLSAKALCRSSRRGLALTRRQVSGDTVA